MPEPQTTSSDSAAAGATANDAPQQVDIDPGMALERIDAWLDGAVRLLPNLGVALVMLALFIGAGIVVGRTIRKRAARHDRTNLGEILGSFAKWTIIVFGGLLAATIVVPTLKPGDLIAGMGISSVAIGFAFKDILQNWLAGLLILIRQPFEVGDQIRIEGYEGTVEHIESRATLIRTYDNQRAVIPNSDIYTNAVLVKTAYGTRRSQYDVGIGYADNIGAACEAIVEALSSIEGVETEPAPQAFAWDLAASWVTIRVRWWTDTERADIVQNRAEVIKAIKHALDDKHIDMPYETQVLLMHDQTEAEDGDRNAQREGWPSPSENGTQPRWRAQTEARKQVDFQSGQAAQPGAG